MDNNAKNRFWELASGGSTLSWQKGISLAGLSRLKNELGDATRKGEEG
jgi:hypothetical protein